MNKVFAIIKVCFTALVICSANAYSTTVGETPTQIRDWIYKNPGRAPWVSADTKLQSGDLLEPSILELGKMLVALKNNVQLIALSKIILTAANLNYLVTRAALEVFMKNKSANLDVVLQAAGTTVEKQIKDWEKDGVIKDAKADLETAISDSRKYISGTCITELLVPKKTEPKMSGLDKSAGIIEVEQEKIEKIKNVLETGNLEGNLDFVFAYEQGIDNRLKNLDEEAKTKVKKLYYTALLMKVPARLKAAADSKDFKLVGAILSRIDKFTVQSPILARLYRVVLETKLSTKETLLHYYIGNNSETGVITVLHLLEKVLADDKNPASQEKFADEVLFAPNSEDHTPLELVPSPEMAISVTHKIATLAKKLGEDEKRRILKKASENLRLAFLTIDKSLKMFGCRDDELTTGALTSAGYIQANKLLLTFENAGQAPLPLINNPVPVPLVQQVHSYHVRGNYPYLEFIGDDGAIIWEEGIDDENNYPIYINENGECYYHIETVNKQLDDAALCLKINTAVQNYNNFAKEINQRLVQ